MTHIHTQWGVGHNPCYTPTTIGIVTEGSGTSMEMATVYSINTILHAAVFQIIFIPTQGKKKHFFSVLHAYSMGYGP